MIYGHGAEGRDHSAGRVILGPSENGRYWLDNTRIYGPKEGLPWQENVWW